MPKRLSHLLTEDVHLAKWLRSYVDGEIESVESIQSLWSGYGEIVKVHLRQASLPSVILKWVAPPDTMNHPRGWSGQTSHERKLRSYEVERCFYTDWCPDPHPSHRTAKCFAADRTSTGWRFLLEDLDASGFAERRGTASPKDIARCLDWLAAFHARHLGCSPTGLWPRGTYWHLATRPDELAATEDAELRAAAEPLDRSLSSARFQTLVHGDAKVANFCFGQESVAAVDFQYVGGGPGIQDVAYFLSSCLSDSECEREAPRHLDQYFEFLAKHLAASGSNHPTREVESEWRELYPTAWADFHRFLVGWAPDHWKIHRYTRRMTREAITNLAKHDADRDEVPGDSHRG